MKHHKEAITHNLLVIENYLIKIRANPGEDISRLIFPAFTAENWDTLSENVDSGRENLIIRRPSIRLIVNIISIATNPKPVSPHEGQPTGLLTQVLLST